MSYLVDNFTGTLNTLLTAHTSDSGHTYTKITTGFWITNGGGTNNLKLVGDGKVYSPDGASGFHFSNSDQPLAEYDITFTLHVLDTNSNGRFEVYFRASTVADTMYRFSFAAAGCTFSKVLAGSGTNLTDGTLSAVTFTVGTYTIKIEVRDASKKLYVDGTLKWTNTDNAITAAGRAGYGSALSTAGTRIQASSFVTSAAVAPLVAPTISVIDQTLTTWNTGTGQATSVAPTAVGLYCPTPSSGTPAYTYQWHVSTSTGFTPSGGTAVAGGTNQIQLVTGLTASTTYYAKCVVSDAAPSSVTTAQVTFTTPAAYPAGAAIVVEIGDSTGISTGEGMRTIIDSDRSRSDTVHQGCSKSSTDTSNWVSGNSNNWLKYAVVIANAHGATAINLMQGINDGQESIASATFAANLDDMISYITGQGLKAILHYVLFNNSAGGTGTTANGFIDLYNAHMDSVVNGTTILKGDKQAKNYFSHHTDLFSDNLHPTAPGYTSLGKFRGRAMAWRLGLVTPAISLSPSAVSAGSTGNSVAVTGTKTGWDDGSPGHPTLTGSAGTLSAQTLPAFDGAGSFTFAAPGTGQTVTVTDPDSGASATIVVSATSSVYSIHRRAKRLNRNNRLSSRI